MKLEPLLLCAPPGWVVIDRGGLECWVCDPDPGENSIAHSSSIASSSPNVLVTVIGAHEKSGGAVSATIFVVVTVDM